MQAVSERTQASKNGTRMQVSPPYNTAVEIEPLQAKEIDVGGDEDPTLPDEHLECEATQEEL